MASHLFKELEKLCKLHDGTRVRDGAAKHDRRSYLFPDGFSIVFNTSDGNRRLQEWMGVLRARYGQEDGESLRLVHRPGRPEIDFGRLRASRHAGERLALMRRQAGVEFAEVLHALRLPERVGWSVVHESWVFVRDRLAVAVAEAAEGFVVTTLLWSSRALWAENPRPGKRGA